MTRRAIISDIHGNVEALRAVLDDINRHGVDEIYCLGDIVGYGPDPRLCVQACYDFQMVLLGNHDNGALFDPDGFSSGAERAVFWTRKQLEDTNSEDSQPCWEYIAKLPRTHCDQDFMYVHGSPRSPLNEYVFPEDVYNQRKIERLFGFIRKYCFQGHTHVPGVFTENYRFYSPADIGDEFEFNDQKLMVNVGSVGQPRDGDPRSSYAIVDDDGIKFQRVDYDPTPTRDKIYAIEELDNFLGDRLLEGR